MDSAVSGFDQRLLSKEIRLCVAKAVISNTPYLSASACAAEILKNYPDCGIDHATLADQIMIAAAKAGVAVEVGGASHEGVEAII